MIGRVNEIRLRAKQQRALQAIVSRPSEAAGLVRRARAVLLSDDGVPAGEIAMRLGLTAEAVSRIRRRFLHSAVKGLSDRPKAGRKDHALSPETVDKLVHLAMSPPPAGRARWTTRLLARQFGISSGAVSDALRRNNVKPHLVRTYKVSRDPEFASKVNAIVLSVDEKTSIQALERTQPPLPLRSGRAVRHTHDYKRHGIVDLYAALEIATGKVTHQVSDSHTAHDFLTFMKKVVRSYPQGELHVILDNSSAHGTPEVQRWLEENPLVRFHYTPTSASWLNQVEGFFGILGKQSLFLTDFRSKKALRDHLRAYMKGWNRNPTPFEWTKPAKAIIRSHRRMLDRISTAVH